MGRERRVNYDGNILKLKCIKVKLRYKISYTTGKALKMIVNEKSGEPSMG